MLLSFSSANCRTHDHKCLQCKALRSPPQAEGGGARRSIPLSGRVVASQTVWPRGSQKHSGVSPEGTRILKMSRREEEGGLFKLGGRAPGGVCNKRRNRLRPCRTTRVFLSGGITSTFRQEQELGGKQQHELTALR